MGTVTLRYNTPLWVCSEATRQCWDSRDKSDSYVEDIGVSIRDADEFDENCIITGTKDKALIERIGNQHKHKSVLEHLVYSFDIDGISRACLQELARHRMASYSVKSTRYTLKELKNEVSLYNSNPEEFTWRWEVIKDYVVLTDNEDVNIAIAQALHNLKDILEDGASNDKAKYCLPEAYKTSLTWTINARSLQNFLELRTSPHALWEIRELAHSVFEALPEEHKYLFKGFIYKQPEA